jgi:hypothetical protein
VREELEGAERSLLLRNFDVLNVCKEILDAIRDDVVRNTGYGIGRRC